MLERLVARELGVDLERHALDEREAAGNPRRAPAAGDDLAAPRLELGQVVAQLGELQQRDGAMREPDAILELLDGEPALEVVGAQEVDDRGAVAIAGPQRA